MPIVLTLEYEEEIKTIQSHKQLQTKNVLYAIEIARFNTHSTRLIQSNCYESKKWMREKQWVRNGEWERKRTVPTLI